MFGRFGRGGGNFVAQYRVYPVSFVDKVRLLPSSARAVPRSRATVTHHAAATLASLLPTDLVRPFLPAPR